MMAILVWGLTAGGRKGRGLSSWGGLREGRREGEEALLAGEGCSPGGEDCGREGGRGGSSRGGGRFFLTLTVTTTEHLAGLRRDCIFVAPVLLHVLKLMPIPMKPDQVIVCTCSYMDVVHMYVY